MKEKIQRFRKWFITLFDELATPDSIYDLITTHKQTHYCIIGKELSPTNKKLHYHIYVEFDNACTWDSLKKMFPKADIEDAHGTASQCKAYITKDGEYKEFGIPTAIKYNSDDIALNVIEYMKNNPDVDLFNIALDCPEFCDYIVKNYRNLSLILDNIRTSEKQEKIKYWQNQ